MAGLTGEVPGLIATFPTTSTGLKQYSFVKQSTSGNLIVTTLGSQALGVIQAGTTSSTRHGPSLPVMLSGISKVRTTGASTLGIPDLVSAGAAGGAVVSTGSVVGRIVGGSSGGSGRILFVHLAGPSVTS